MLSFASRRRLPWDRSLFYLLPSFPIQRIEHARLRHDRSVRHLPHFPNFAQLTMDFPRRILEADNVVVRWAVHGQDSSRGHYAVDRGVLLLQEMAPGEIRILLKARSGETVYSFPLSKATMSRCLIEKTRDNSIRKGRIDLDLNERLSYRSERESLTIKMDESTYQRLLPFFALERRSRNK